MKFPIPPHIGWPLLVISLLGISIGASLITVLASRSDGGAQIIDNYYEKAVNWDATHANQAASDALQWTTTLHVEAAQPSGLRLLELTVQDAAGGAVSNLRGTVKLYRPDQARPVATIPISEASDAPGVYRQQVPLTATGLWDVQVVAARDGSPVYQTTLRHEVSR
jgi:nitrogen fixation protein FixH